MKKISTLIRSFIQSLTKKPRKRTLPFQVNYHENWLVPPMAIFVGIFIVLYAHHRGFGEAIFMLAFYKAAIPSIAAAWLMMRYIAKKMYPLDQYFPWAITWWRGPLPRVVLQVWHGVLIPGFAVLTFYAFYFTVREQPLRFWRYLNEDFSFVVLMLLGFNALIWVYYRLRAREIMDEYRQWRHKYNKTEEEMEELWNTGGTTDVVPALEKVKDKIALLEPNKQRTGKSRSTTFEGKQDDEPYTMRDFYKKVMGPDYYRIRPELIIHRKAIASMREEGRVVMVTLAAPRPGQEIKVADRQREEFLIWWVMEEED
ncbi:hypothetical protein SAMN05216436_114128 [bacterium A37T11]|nr:hypothetical protein SAMN05216436_114128 [bacterium A37T11]